MWLKSHVCKPLHADCPGTESEQAGKAAACKGCPNQNVCASSKPAGPDPGKSVSVNTYLQIAGCHIWLL